MIELREGDVVMVKKGVRYKEKPYSVVFSVEKMFLVPQDNDQRIEIAIVNMLGSSEDSNKPSDNSSSTDAPD
jgi:hypothetical protein